MVVEGWVLQMVTTILSRIDFKCLLVSHHFIFFLYSFSFQPIAHISSSPILHLEYDYVAPIPEELFIGQVLCSKISLECCWVLTIQLFFDIIWNLFDWYRTAVATLLSWCVDWLIKIGKVFDGIDDSAWWNGSDGQVGIFVSEPGCHCSRIGSTHRYPRIIRNLI